MSGIRRPMKFYTKSSSPKKSTNKPRPSINLSNIKTTIKIRNDKILEKRHRINKKELFSKFNRAIVKAKIMRKKAKLHEQKKLQDSLRPTSWSIARSGLNLKKKGSSLDNFTTYISTQKDLANELKINSVFTNSSQDPNKVKRRLDRRYANDFMMKEPVKEYKPRFGHSDNKFNIQSNKILHEAQLVYWDEKRKNRSQEALKRKVSFESTLMNPGTKTRTIPARRFKKTFVSNLSQAYQKRKKERDVIYLLDNPEMFLQEDEIADIEEARSKSASRKSSTSLRKGNLTPLMSAERTKRNTTSRKYQQSKAESASSEKGFKPSWSHHRSKTLSLSRFYPNTPSKPLGHKSWNQQLAPSTLRERASSSQRNNKNGHKSHNERDKSAENVMKPADTSKEQDTSISKKKVSKKMNKLKNMFRKIGRTKSSYTIKNGKYVMTKASKIDKKLKKSTIGSRKTDYLFDSIKGLAIALKLQKQLKKHKTRSMLMKYFSDLSGCDKHFNHSHDVAYVTTGMQRFKRKKRKAISKTLGKIRHYEIKKKGLIHNKKAVPKLYDKRMICEKDRLRIREFGMNEYAIALAMKSDKSKMLSLDSIDNDIKEKINDRIVENRLVHDVYKDIRYAYYMQRSAQSLINFSKNSEINKAFKSTYPNTHVENLKTFMLASLKSSKKMKDASLEDSNPDLAAKEKKGIFRLRRLWKKMGIDDELKCMDYELIGRTIRAMLEEADLNNRAGYYLKKFVVKKMQKLSAENQEIREQCGKFQLYNVLLNLVHDKLESYKSDHDGEANDVEDLPEGDRLDVDYDENGGVRIDFRRKLSDMNTPRMTHQRSDKYDISSHGKSNRAADHVSQGQGRSKGSVANRSVFRTVGGDPRNINFEDLKKTIQRSKYKKFIPETSRPVMPKTSRWRAIVNMLLDFSELCGVTVEEVVSLGLINKEFKKDFEIMYLFDLMKSGDIRKIRVMLKQNPMIKFEINEEGKTMLHVAVLRCSPEVVEELIAFKFNVNARDKVELIFLIDF